MNLRHVAIIPDGNRRWARARNLPTFIGHKEGAKTAKKIFEKAVELKIPFFTFWGTSLDNVRKREKEEVAFLFELFESYFRELLDDPKIYENRIRVRALGRWRELFPDNLARTIEEVLKKTKNYDRLNLTVLLAYSGQDEMIDAIEKLKMKNEEITNEAIKSALWTAELPAVDLVIRTGGEPHWSQGFMMWDTADAALHFTETLWPDFAPEDFEKIVRAKEAVERRFGK
jgi:undecaprenyl diphosphate synthase